MSAGGNKANTGNSRRGGKISVDVCHAICFILSSLNEVQKRGICKRDGMRLTLISDGEG